MSRATEMQGFLPDDYVELRTQRRTNILWALIFLIVAGGIGWAYFIAQNKVMKAEEYNAAVNRDYAAAAKPHRPVPSDAGRATTPESEGGTCRIAG